MPITYGVSIDISAAAGAEHDWEQLELDFAWMSVGMGTAEYTFADEEQRDEAFAAVRSYARPEKFAFNREE